MGLLLLLAVSCVVAYTVAVLTVGNMFLYAVGVGLIDWWGFAAALQPKSAVSGSMFLTMSIVVTNLSSASTGVASFIIVELSSSVAIGIGVVFIAHLLIPHRPVPLPATATPASAMPHAPLVAPHALAPRPRHLAAPFVPHGGRNSGDGRVVDGQHDALPAWTRPRR